MKISNKLLSLFLDKLEIGSEVKNFLVKFESGGMSTLITDKAQCILGSIKIRKESLIGFEERESVGIKNLKSWKNFVSRFNGEIDFNIKTNVIEMKSASKKIKMSLIEKDYATSPEKDISLLKYEVPEFQIETKTLKDILKDAEIYGNSNIRFEAKDGHLVITIKEPDGNDEIVTRKAIPILSGHTFNVVFQQTFLKWVINRLTEESVKVKMQTDFPMSITELGKEIKAVYVCTPLVEAKKEESE